MLTINTVKIVNGLLFKICPECHEAIFEGDKQEEYTINTHPFLIHSECKDEILREKLQDDEQRWGEELINDEE